MNREWTGDVPLSFAQQRLWFLDQFEPGSVVDNIPAAVRLTGPLKVTALEQSLNEIVRRHDVLRATFPTVDGQPYQVICPALPLRQAQGQLVTLSVVDLRELPEVEREAEARRLATAEAQQPFDLARGPLVRTAVLQLGDEDHILLLTMHHIVSDSWSTRVLFQELSVLYEAFSTDSPSPLPALTLQYADFARWQRQWLQGEVLEQQLSYWKQRLGDTRPVLELPIRPPAADETNLPRRDPLLNAAIVSVRIAQSPEPARRGHPVHDPVGRLSDPAASLHRAGRHRGGRAHRRSQSGGGRGTDRIFCQYRGVAHQPRGQPEFSRAAGAGARGGAGSLCAPGVAVREAGRGITAGAGSQPHAAVPGDVPVEQRPRRGPAVIRLERGELRV